MWTHLHRVWMAGRRRWEYVLRDEPIYVLTSKRINTATNRLATAGCQTRGDERKLLLKERWEMTSGGDGRQADVDASAGDNERPARYNYGLWCESAAHNSLTTRHGLWRANRILDATRGARSFQFSIYSAPARPRRDNAADRRSWLAGRFLATAPRRLSLRKSIYFYLRATARVPSGPVAE